MISETSYRLNCIFKVCTPQADICVEPDTDVELISNDTVTESILCDLDRALVTLSFSCFPLRFNLCAMSFLNKVVSEPQSNKALVSMKVCPFDSFTGIICSSLKSNFASVSYPKSHAKGVIFNRSKFPKIIRKNVKTLSMNSTLRHINPLSANFTKCSNKLKQFVGKLPVNCLSVFDHFVGLALKGLD